MTTGESITTSNGDVDKIPEQALNAEEMTRTERAEVVLAILDAYDAQQIDDNEMFDLLSDYSIHHRYILGGSPEHTTLKKHIGIAHDNWLAKERAKLSDYDQAIAYGLDVLNTYEVAIEKYSRAINATAEPAGKSDLHSQLEQAFEEGKLEATKQHDKMRNPTVTKSGKRLKDGSAEHFSQLMQGLTAAKRVLDAKGAADLKSYRGCCSNINQLLLLIAQENYVKAEHELHDLRIKKIDIETAIELTQELFDRDTDKRQKQMADLLRKIRRVASNYIQ